MQKTDELVNTLVKAVSDIQNKKAKGYDTQAQVTRVDGNTAYVHIPGGVDETPAQLTINAKKGDTVRVRVAGGTAWLVGNASNPPTDDATANAASAVANTASTMAGEAVESANIAQEAAESAQASAAEAKTSANEAKTQAIQATTYANNALTQLSTVEDVVDVLNWISEHGTYKASTDTEVVAGKYYFIRTGSGTTTDPYVYDVVVSPTGDPSEEGYYELDSVDEAVSNYISSHLALTDEGLYIVKDGSGYKVLINNTGMKVYDPTGQQCFLINANSMIYKPTVYGQTVRFLQDSQTNYLVYTFDETPDADSSLYVEAFTGTADATPVTDIVDTFRPLDEQYPNNYMRIQRAQAVANDLIDYDYDSTGMTSVPLYVRYAYSQVGKGGALKIGTSTFNSNTVLGISGHSTEPLFEISSIGEFNYKNQYPIVYNPVTKADVQRADITLTTSSSDAEWLKALIKAICTAYPECEGRRFNGVLNPNSSGYYTIYIYDTSDIDEYGLPKYSYGTYRKYISTTLNFGTSNYAFSIQQTNTAAGVGAVPLSGGTMTGSLAVKKATVGTNTYADTNPKLMFQNSNASQNISLTYTDYDSIKSPASLTLNGNQGGEWFIAPNIYAGAKYEVGTAGTIAANGTEMQINPTGTLSLNGFGIGGSSGNWWGAIPTIDNSSGVMEVGRYIDFHISDTGTSDYDYRMNLTASGAMTFSGTLTLSGHNTAIGSIIDAYLSSNKSLSASTATMLVSISLPAGTWVCTCGIRFASSTSGYRMGNLETTSGNGAFNITQAPVNGNVTQMLFTKIITTTATTTYYLNGYSTAAVTVNSSGANYGTFIRAVRIA